MTDLVVATPVFLDLTFVGLESLPALGEERFAAELLRSPGGGAITAVGAARLGLSVAVAAPLGADVAGDLVRAGLAEDGVESIATRTAPRTPTTVVMPFSGDRAMVTIDPGVRATAADVSVRAPRAVAASLDQLDVVPAGAFAYVTCGDGFRVAATLPIGKSYYFMLGVNNVADKNPPLVLNGSFSDCPNTTCNDNTWTGTYDTLGRYIFFNMTAQF